MTASEDNYVSGDDYVIEFMRYEFRFAARDFEERVCAAAVRLAIVEIGDLDTDAVGDLVELTWQGRIAEPRGGLGESLVYWLRKLVFRGAYLDHRVKAGLLDVSWDEGTGDFGYAEPEGGRTLLELAPTPSWAAVQFRG